MSDPFIPWDLKITNDKEHEGKVKTTRGFSIAWLKKDMKKPGFQAWLDNKVAYMQKDIPDGFLLRDSYMNRGDSDMVTKTWRYIHYSDASLTKA